ncbi:MAG TPA: SRPBCC family protein [Jatrophihabitans sp.]|nr:SRPBCC family protein [Jatrophihabitans sp.]
MTRRIEATPEAVYAVLADGWRYSNWVVGTSHMRAVESEWPATGARLHHCSGIWPLVTRDETIVEESEPNRRLVLLAKGGILGSARVVLELEQDGDGTIVSLSEAPVAGFGKWVHNPGLDLVLARRNVETLARLAALSERHTEPVS